MTSLKRNYPFLLILLGLNLANSYFWFHGTCTGGEGGGITYYTSSSFDWLFFSWSNSIYSGIPQIPSSISVVILYAIGVLLMYVLGCYAPFITAALYASVGAIGIYLLIYVLSGEFGEVDERLRIFGGLCAAIIFTIQIDNAQNIIAVAYLIPLALLSGILLVKRLDQQKNWVSEASLAAIFFSLALGFGYYSNGLTMLVFFITVFVILLITARRIVIKDYIIAFSFVAVAALLVNFVWIIPLLLFLHTNYITQFSQQFNQLALAAGQAPFPLSLLYFAPVVAKTAPQLISMNDYLAIVLIAILTVSLLGIALVIKNGKRTALRFVAAFGVCYLILAALAGSLDPPFGIFLNWLTEITSLVLVLRAPYQVTYPFILLVISILFGCGVVLICRRLGNHKKIKALYIVCIVILLCAYVYFLDIVPILNSYGYPNQNISLLRHPIPASVLQLSEFINMQGGYFSVASLPSESGIIVLPWYWGADVYSNFVKSPFYNGDYGYFFYPISIQEYFTYAGYPMTYSTPVDKGVANWFDVLGIRYVIVENDILPNALCPEACTDYPEYSVNTIISNLDSTNFSKVTVYNGTALYENERYVPLVYPARLDVLNTSNMSALSAAIESPTFNSSDTAIYSRVLSMQSKDCSYVCSIDLYNSTGVIDLPQAEGNLPSINYLETSPTSVTVSVINASGPFYLVFRQTYDQQWQAYYDNGTSLDTYEHIAVNGFANAWYVDGKGSYTIRLYYTQQSLTWILWCISIGALVALLYMSILNKRV